MQDFLPIFWVRVLGNGVGMHVHSATSTCPDYFRPLHAHVTSFLHKHRMGLHECLELQIVQHTNHDLPHGVQNHHISGCGITGAG